MRWLGLLLCPLIAYGQDLTSMTQVMNGVDDGTYHVNLGHSFPYYDKVFTNAWMSSNGVIIMYDPASNVGNPNTYNSYCCSGLDISNNPNPYYNYLIAPLWTDLTDRNPDPEAGYYYRTSAEQTSFLWNKVYEYGTSNVNTFEAELFKDGSFKFNYGDISITRHSVFIGNTGDLSNASPQFTQQYFGQNLTNNDVQGLGTLGTAVVEPTIDCTNPLNDPSCDGYYAALVPTTPVVNVTLPEPEPVVEPEPIPEPEPVVEPVVTAAPIPVIVQEPEPLPEPEPVVVSVASVEELTVAIIEEPIVEQTSETPAVIQKYVSALIATLTAPQATSLTTSNSVAVDTPVTEVAEAFAVSTVATISTTPTQTAESQETTPALDQTTKQADVQFEADFNDAIGAGQSIGQFLSAQLPDFSRFDVAPPSQQEQRTTQRATQALQTMSQEDITKSTEAQLKEMQESGGFSDQSLTVLLISNNPDFNQYNNITLDDRSQFYENRVIYRGNYPTDNSRALLRGSGSSTYEAMVDQQWQR